MGAGDELLELAAALGGRNVAGARVCLCETRTDSAAAFRAASDEPGESMRRDLAAGLCC